MTTRSLRGITPVIWVPPTTGANWKVTVTRSDDSVDDITDILLMLKIEDGVTSSIGNFEFEIPNPNETYTNVWTGMEIFRFYCDYGGGVAATLRFRGRIEKPSNQNNNLKVTGRGESLFVQDRDVNATYTAQDGGYIVKDLFDTYDGGRFDTSSIDISTGVTLTLSFLDLPFWDAIESVCTAMGYDCYVDADLVVQFFLAGSITNEDEGIVHDSNLLEVGDFAPDVTFVKNQIKVIGGVVDGVQVMYTAVDLTSQTAYGIRPKTFNDDGLTNFDDVKENADYILADLKDPPTVGDVTGTMLATIKPGDKIRLSSPQENLPPAAYRISHFVHKITDGFPTTTVTVNKEAKRLSHVLKDRIQREHRLTDAAGNPNDLDFAEIELFNSASGSYSSTEISQGVLKMTTGNSSGSWTSAAIATANAKNVDEIRIGIVGDNLPGCTILVSADNGLNYQTVGRDDVIIMGSTGKAIKIKLNLAGSATQIDSVRIQYSTVA